MTVTRTDAPGASESTPHAGPADAADAPTDLEQPAPPNERAPLELILLAVAAIVVGVGFRFVARTPLWLDEALSVNIAALPLGDIVEALRHDGHPPLYYFLLHGWMSVFGESDTTVRALSGVFAVLTIPLAWFVGRRRGGPVLGWTFVAVLSVSAYAVRYTTDTRMYSLVMLLVFVGYLLADDVLRREKPTILRLVGLAVVSGLLLLTHYWSMFLIGALLITVLWRAWRQRASQPARAKAGVRLAIAVVIGSVVCFGPWLGVMRYQTAHTGTPWSAPFRPTTSAAVTLTDFNAGSNQLTDGPVIVIAAALLLALGLFGRAVDARNIDIDVRTDRQFRYEAVIAALTFGLGLAAGLASRSAFASRYAAVLYPLVMLIIAGGVTRFVSRWLRFGVLAVFLALCGIGVVYSSLLYQRSESRVIATSIATKAQPGDLVVYCPDQLGPSGLREVQPGLRQVAYPRLNDPALVDWVDYGDRNATNDPQAVAQDVLELAGPEHAIFVVWAGTYRTMEGQCEAFVNAISAQRPESQTLVNDEAERFYEHANLSYFGPAPAP